MFRTLYTVVVDSEHLSFIRLEEIENWYLKKYGRTKFD